jgi:hypothetical protein
MREGGMAPPEKGTRRSAGTMHEEYPVERFTWPELYLLRVELDGYEGNYGYEIAVDGATDEYRH